MSSSPCEPAADKFLSGAGLFAAIGYSMFPKAFELSAEIMQHMQRKSLLLRKLACFEAGGGPECRLLQYVLRNGFIDS